MCRSLNEKIIQLLLEERYTTREIALQCGVTLHTVRYTANKINKQTLNTKERVKLLYSNNFNSREIAETLKINLYYVRKLIGIDNLRDDDLSFKAQIINKYLDGKDAAVIHNEMNEKYRISREYINNILCNYRKSK